MKLNRVSQISIAAASVLMLAACNNVRLPFGNTTQQRNANIVASTERVTVGTGVIENQVIGSGSIIARKTLDVPYLRAGLVLQVFVKQGDTVKRGDPIAKLDASDLELTSKQQWNDYLSLQAAYSQTLAGPTAAELRAAQAALGSAQAAYADLNKGPTESALAASKADLMNAEATLRVKQSAYDKRAGRDPGVGASQEALDLESATNAYIKAKASYDGLFSEASKAQYASASSQIAAAQKNMSALKPTETAIEQARLKMESSLLTWQATQRNISNTLVLAPTDGLITVLNADVGEYAGSGGAAAQVADFAEPVFQTLLDETDLANVKVGQEARIQLQSFTDKPVLAKVSWIDSVGTTSNNIVAYKAWLTIPRTNDLPDIRLGMSGTSIVITKKIEDAVMVPATALIVDTTTNTYAALIPQADGTTQRINVSVGAKSGDQLQVLAGLKVGDVIAVPLVTASANAGGPGGGAGPQQPVAAPAR